LEKAKIAIIEDEAIIAKDLEIMLGNAGYDISGVFSNAEEAINQFESKKPDIVLIDISLSGQLDGIEAGKYLKEFLSLPIIYLTANSDEYTLSKVKKIEPDGLILKPYGEKQLKSTIDSALQKNGHRIDNNNEQVSSVSKEEQSMKPIYENPDVEQFIYLASHDLQEPLRMIASYVQLLRKKYKGKLDPDAEDYIAFAVDGVNRMKNMIDDLLIYSRLSSWSSFKKLTNLNVEVGRAIEKINNTFGHQNQVIKCGELPELVVNPEQINLLFYSLINNAVKFNRSKIPEIEISCARNGTWWQFAVKDNGPGIENQYAEKVFNIFQKLHNNKEHKGTGMGLAISKKIMELHNGRIWFVSKPEEGTTFYFTLGENQSERSSNG